MFFGTGIFCQSILCNLSTSPIAAFNWIIMDKSTTVGLSSPPATITLQMMGSVERVEQEGKALTQQCKVEWTGCVSWPFGTAALKTSTMDTKEM